MALLLEYSTKNVSSAAEVLVAQITLFTLMKKKLKWQVLLSDERKKEDCMPYQPCSNKVMLYSGTLFLRSSILTISPI